MAIRGVALESRIQKIKAAERRWRPQYWSAKTKPSLRWLEKETGISYVWIHRWRLNQRMLALAIAERARAGEAV